MLILSAAATSVKLPIDIVSGASGTIDCATANAVLDAFVDIRRRAAACKHLEAFNSDAWRDLGMVVSLAVASSDRAAPQAYAEASVESRNSSPRFFPRTSLSSETQHALAAIWTQLLGVEQIAADDSFFLLGGHPLMTMRALVQIQDRFGANLVLRDIFDAPTVAKLAARIDETRPPASAAARPAENEDREELVS